MPTVIDETREFKLSEPKVVPTYRTGSVARLSGVPVETLRVWERRYAVVNPRRSAHGQREYTMEEIKHLSLIKQLVDLGNPIGVIARLPREDLLSMLASANTALSVTTGPRAGGMTYSEHNKIRTVIIGERNASSLVGMCHSTVMLEAVGSALTLNNALSRLIADSADLLILEINELAEVDFKAISEMCRRSGARSAVVLYRFARHAVIRQLRSCGYLVARIPTEAHELEIICQRALAQRVTPTGLQFLELAAPLVEPVQFDDHALDAIEAATNSIYCECPRHLVEILRNLTSFERYSEQCENRSPADQQMHYEIGQSAAAARTILEDILLRVAMADGLPLPN